jgi:GNAT superfamily N-acetyltransferase
VTSFPFRSELLGPAHDRTSFRCGEEILDRYLQTQATQDIRRRVANCFVAVEAASGQIAAYYTLSAASIPLVDLPPAETRRLPRYPTLPAVRIGRLAVDRRFQGRGLGSAILMNAAHRTMQPRPLPSRCWWMRRTPKRLLSMSTTDSERYRASHGHCFSQLRSWKRLSARNPLSADNHRGRRRSIRISLISSR